MGYLYPIETIRYAARLYFRFTLSFRGAEEILAYRGVIFSYEIILKTSVETTKSV